MGKKYDNLTKEQIDVISHGKGNVLVSASAGSGKTFTIIERIIRLIIEEELDVKKILATTFTNAAASEMKEKLKKALIDKINETTDIRSSKFLRNQLLSVNDSDITTLHSFCLKVIRRYFFKTDLDSSFQVADEIKTEQLKQLAIENVFSDEYLNSKVGDDFYNLFSNFGKRNDDKKIKDFIIKLHNFCMSEASIEHVRDITLNSYKNELQMINDYLINQMRIGYSIILDILPGVVDIEKGKTKSLCEAFLCFYEYFNNTTDDIFTIIQNANEISLFKFARSTDKETDYKKVVNAYSTYFYNPLVSILGKDFVNVKPEDITNKSSKNVDMVNLIFDITEKFDKEYGNLKREENLVDYNDLEHYTLKLLKDESVLNEIKGKYEYIFIDEYQDTNGVQEEIINLIANNNEMMVGDSKQSIYGFRGCNPVFFINKMEKYENSSSQDEKVIHLDANFRSAENIIIGDNKVFSRLLSTLTGNVEYVKNPMIYGGLYKGFQGRMVYDNYCDELRPVEIDDDCEEEEGQEEIVENIETENNEVTKEREKRKVYSVIEDVIDKKEFKIESKIVIKLIKEAIGKEYYDIKEKEEKDRKKKLEFKDIVILKNVLSDQDTTDLIKALIESGIPISVNTKGKMTDYPEVNTVFNMLKVILSYDQDIPLANTLLKFWEFSEKELYLIKQCGMKKESFYTCCKKAMEKNDEIANKLKGFFDYFDKIKVVTGFANAGEIIAKVIQETGWINRTLASSFGEQKMKRVEKLILDGSMGDGYSIYDFVGVFDKSGDKLELPKEMKSNSVRIMSIHESKGLEFPYVIVAGMKHKFNDSDSKGIYLCDRDYGLSISDINKTSKDKSDEEADDVDTIGGIKKLLSQKISFNGLSEQIRKLYVAYTRAKCELHVITYDNSFTTDKEIMKTQNYMEMLSKDDCVELVNWYKDDFDPKDNLGDQNGTGNQEGSENETGSNNQEDPNNQLVEKIKENLAKKYLYEDSCFLSVKKSVTSIKKMDDNEEPLFHEKLSVEITPEMGTAYHRILELIDFYKGDIEGQINEFINKGLIDENLIALIDVKKVESILQMSIFGRIKGYKIYKEKYFYNNMPANEIGLSETSKEEILVQGIIDLLAVKDNKGILIDYKLSSIVNDEDLVKTYQKQLELYKAAIEKNSGIKVVEVWLINILQEKEVKLSI